MDAALGKVFKGKEYQDFLNARGFGLVYADAAGFGEHLAKADKSLGDAMKAAGLAKA
jgi:tripartite-type tricarboxylate transporter receptor subunit TctC